MENKLKFSEEGKSVQIIFKNNSESLFYDSKEEAYKMIRDCYEKKKITAIEFKKFISQISESNLVSIIESMVGLYIVISIAFLDGLLEERGIEPLIDPQFVEVKDVAIPYGYFESEGVKISMNIYSKAEGYTFIDELERRSLIIDGEASGLRVMLDISNSLINNVQAN